MKRIFLIIAIVFGASTVAGAMERVAQIDTSDFIAFGGDPWGGGVIEA